MSYFSKNRFSLRQVVLLLTIVFVVFITIPYAIGKLPVGPIGDTPIYIDGPTFPIGSLPVVNVSVPNAFTSGTTISSSAMNNNFKAVANQMPGIDWTVINKSNIDVTSVVTVGTVSISAPCSGYVVVRFDGYATADTGDRLVLAASDTAAWAANDGNVAFNGDTLSHSFSHTRVYEVSSGNKTFYAVAQNYVDTAGDGKASIHGMLTATFYPNKY
jgi:hypothetical protein